ncbi:DUF1800 domain-containing protein [Ilumatobacter sp.]|uniref:DUF1800 domain-containing protein n=1 Tax=Ilumatobacter sp. TaxID=1967498 RepID=UPI003B521EE3
MPPPLGPGAIGRADAVRFLQRTTFGPTTADVDHLISIGIDAWFDEQSTAARGTTHLQTRIDGAPDVRSCVWGAYLAGTDQLRRRLAYALSQIFVVSRHELDDRSVCAFADLLERHCFDTYRSLLEHVTRSGAMGRYLTYAGNRKEDARRGRVPDENYAREVMQLFSIGLWELAPDGTRRRDGAGQPIAAYDQDDILGLARVFTGFAAQRVGEDVRRFALPMDSAGDHAQRFHERGEKRFLGTVVPAAADRTLDQSLAIALDRLADHPNTGPFIGHQLIQRLVTSNPSPAYVRRVAAVFADDGTGVRGNLLAVARAIVLDVEAWSTTPPPGSGKLREPVLRFTTVARTLGVHVDEGPWPIGSLSDPASELGQQPFESPSVFNFYRPGYVPPQSALGDAGLTSPEMQLANETSAIGWVNHLARFLARPPGRTWSSGPAAGRRSQVGFDLDDLLAPVSTKHVTAAAATALVDELVARLCPHGVDGRVRSATIRRVREVVRDDYDPSRTDARHVALRDDIHLERVITAVVMIAVSTDFLHER